MIKRTLFALAVMMISVFGANNLSAQYCTPSVDYTYGEGIDGVDFAGGGIYYWDYSNYGYADYTQYAYLEISPDNSYDLNVYFNYNMYKGDECGVWFDWNHDSDLSPDELTTLKMDYGNYSAYASITVPSNASTGTTRMRIMLIDAGSGDSMDPCAANQWGETEDYQVEVVAPVKILKQPKSLSICRDPKSNLNLNFDVTGSIYGIVWEKNVNGNWEYVTDGMNSDLNIDQNSLTMTNSNPIQYYDEYRAYIYGPLSSEYTDVVSVYAVDPVTIDFSTSTGLTSMCEGTDLEVYPNVYGSATSTFTWKKYDPKTLTYTNLPIPAGNPLVITNAKMSDAGYYYATVNTEGICDAGQVSAMVNISVNSLFKVLSEPVDVVTCTNNTNELALAVDGNINSYQWYKDGYPLGTGQNPTAQSAVLKFNEIQKANAGDYYVEVNYTDCSGTYSYRSPVAKITVYDQLNIVSQPQSVATCNNTPVMLSVNIAGTVMSYTWEKDGIDVDLTKYPTANKASLFIPNATYSESGTYRCRVIAENCTEGITTVYSDNAYVYINKSTEIVDPPKSAYVNLGDELDFNLAAHVKSLPPHYKVDIRWYKNNVELVDNNRISGSRSSNLHISNVQASDFNANYSVIVTGICGSGTAKFGVFVKPTINITAQPTNVNVCNDSPAEMNITATDNNGAAVKYQWLLNGKTINDQVGFVSGAQSAKLSISIATLLNQGTYTCQLTTMDGMTTITSNPATLTIDNKASVDTKSTDVVNAVTGKDFELFVTLKGTAPFAYQWQKDGSDITGATSDKYSVTTAMTTDAGVYSVKVTNVCGEVTLPISTVAVTASGLSGIENTSEFNFQVLPNPAASFISMNFVSNNVEPYKITLRDVFGRTAIVVNENVANIGNNNFTYDLTNANLSSGSYLLNLEIGSSNITKQIIIVK